jgi:hypothetical protein
VPFAANQIVLPAIVGEPFSVFVPSGSRQSTCGAQSVPTWIRMSCVPVTA